MVYKDKGPSKSEVRIVQTLVVLILVASGFVLLRFLIPDSIGERTHIEQIPGQVDPLLEK